MGMERLQRYYERERCHLHEGRFLQMKMVSVKLLELEGLFAELGGWEAESEASNYFRT